MRRIGLLLSAMLLGTFCVTMPMRGRIVAQTGSHASSEKPRIEETVKILRPIHAQQQEEDQEEDIAPDTQIHAAPSAPRAVQRTLLASVDKPDISQRHKELADSVLRALTPHCRTYLRTFIVRYDNPARRGLGGKSTIILDGSVPESELAALLIHECGHVIHGNMPGTSASGRSAFADGDSIFYQDSPMVAFFSISWQSERVLRAESADADFASGYASTNAFEDFAESYAFYVLHRDAFAMRTKDNAAMAAKYAWMQRYLPMASSPGFSLYTPDNSIPWDITRLPMMLRLEQTALNR